jgi:hypothetical protein
MCSAALDTPVSAQAGTVVDPRKDARIRLGPLYVTPTFQLRDVGVDTNVFDSPTRPVSDFTATLAPRADAWVPFGRRALLTTATAIAFVYYNQYSEARSVDPLSLVRGDFYARHLTFFAENQYLRTSERSFEVDAGLARRAENATAAGVSFQASPRLGWRLRRIIATCAMTTIRSLARIFGPRSNRTETGVRVTARHKVTPLTTLVVHAETQRARFEFSPNRDANGLRIAPGFEFSPKALISGKLEVGIRRLSAWTRRCQPFKAWSRVRR